MSVHVQAFRLPDFPDSEKFKQVFDSEMIGILFWDSDGYIFHANNTLLDMIGYTSEEMLTGKLRWTDITPPEYAYLDHEMYKRLMAGEPVVPYEKQYIHKDGRRIDILIRSTFCNHTINMGMACILDITQQKKAEQEVQQSREVLQQYANKLEASNRDLERFAGLVSHGLQEPLRKVLLFSEHLKTSNQDILDLEAIDDIERILRTSQRMKNLVNDLLDLSRIARRGQVFQKTELTEVMQDVSYDLHHLRKEMNGKIEIKIEEGLSLEADATQLRQMLDQLIENALKFARPDVPPVVRVSASQINHHCCITIEDNAQGIDEPYLSQIFEPFISFPKQGQAAQDRSGIGLSIVQKIVERHDGKIQVQSQKGEGSVFTVTLPLKH